MSGLNKLTGFDSRCKISCGHIEGVRAENGPPGVGTKSESQAENWVDSDMQRPSPPDIAASSSSSDSVSAE